MDVLVMLEETPDQSHVLAHVSSVPAPQDLERPSRDVVTVYGDPNAEAIALALAAAVACHRTGAEAKGPETIGEVRVWAERGALGEAAWRDDAGRLVTRDLEIPLDILRETATQLMRESGQVIRRLVAGLSMPDWPEGVRRAIAVTLAPIMELSAPVVRPLEAAVERWREADGLAFDYDGE